MNRFVGAEEEAAKVVDPAEAALDEDAEGIPLPPLDDETWIDDDVPDACEDDDASLFQLLSIFSSEKTGDGTEAVTAWDCGKDG